jgi:hypothetical protein
MIFWLEAECLKHYATVCSAQTTLGLSIMFPDVLAMRHAMKNIFQVKERDDSSKILVIIYYTTWYHNSKYLNEKYKYTRTG